MASVTFKVKHYDRSVSKHVLNENSGKKLAQMIGQRVTEEVMAAAAPKIARKYNYTVAQHNRRVILETAIYFQRVVSRTPKDEKYYNPETKRWHYPDDDYVWKSWAIKYWGKIITAEQMGESLFEDFNDKSSIDSIASIITKLYGGDKKISNRKTRIKNIRIENMHPRFAQLEYGSYVPKDSSIKEGERQHGRVNGYSVQAPYGMERITRAEMAEFTPTMLDNYFGGYGSVRPEHDQIPTGEEMKELSKIMLHHGILRRHLMPKDIEKIAEVMDK